MKNNCILSYQQRRDLTHAEKRAINHYKDLINKQYKWKLKPPEGALESVGIDCYVVNSFLRGKIHTLSPMDIRRLNWIVLPLTSAIEKSVVGDDVVVMKGLTDSSWIERLNVNDIYVERAFGSFTTKQDVADTYVKENKDGKRVYLIRTLHAGERALFVDSDENEYILPCGKIYTITRIINYHDRIIYYISEA